MTSPAQITGLLHTDDETAYKNITDLDEHTNKNYTWMWKWDNILKTWRKERSFLISLQPPHYNLRTIHWLQKDRSLCTKVTLTFLTPQSTEMGFQKILILLCRHDEMQLCPVDNILKLFLFMINQYGVNCEARETPHCILKTTAITK